ncbi:MAG: type I methionyl aminopeptidase [Candidatus Acetothermia bacterium]
MIEVKSPEELEILRQNATILGQILDSLIEAVRPGVTTAELDQLAENAINRNQATPAFKGYRGFPNTLCASINEEIVHGIPSARELQEGEVISMDLGLNKDGYFADAATTVPVGDQLDPVYRDLIEAGKVALSSGFGAAVVGNRVSDISHAVEECVTNHGFSVVREFVGHGIGRNLHEDPQIPNYGPPGKGARLQEGMVFAIEPMLKTDDSPVEILEDGWTAVTENRCPTVHFEGMVVVTDSEPEILVTGGV